jgi:hypothetical protein
MRVVFLNDVEEGRVMLSYYTPVVLAGHTIMLEPLTLDHAPDLLQALNNDEEIWRYIPVEQPKTAAVDGSQPRPGTQDSPPTLAHPKTRKTCTWRI